MYFYINSLLLGIIEIKLIQLWSITVNLVVKVINGKESYERIFIEITMIISLDTNVLYVLVAMQIDENLDIIWSQNIMFPEK